MTDEEVIRKAVEYAEGWELLGPKKTMADTTVDFVRTPIGYLSVAWDRFLDCPAFTDALAAQLVRQVDRMQGYDIVIYDDWTHIESDLGGRWDVMYESEGHGRTMNTLRVIVEAAEDEDFRRKLTKE